MLNDGQAFRWPDLDLDLSVAGITNGLREDSWIALTFRSSRVFRLIPQEFYSSFCTFSSYPARS